MLKGGDLGKVYIYIIMRVKVGVRQTLEISRMGVNLRGDYLLDLELIHLV